MTEPLRLLSASKNPATRHLLEAGLHDRAPDDVAAVIGAALGLGVVSSAATAAGATSAAASATVAALAPSAGTAALPAIPALPALPALPVTNAALPSVLGIVKWLAIGACAGAVTSGGYIAATGEPSREVPVAVDSANVVNGKRSSAQGSRSQGSPADDPERAPALALPPEAPAAGALGASVEPPPGAPRRSASVPASNAPATEPASTAAAAPSPPTSAASPAADSDLERETRLVDGARKALADHDLNRANELLDRYVRTRVIGVLDREAWVLRVELLVARGNLESARSLAERFERKYPHDAHIGRLRALVSK